MAKTSSRRAGKVGQLCISRRSRDLAAVEALNKLMSDLDASNASPLELTLASAMMHIANDQQLTISNYSVHTTKPRTTARNNAMLDFETAKA